VLKLNREFDFAEQYGCKATSRLVSAIIGKRQSVKRRRRYRHPQPKKKRNQESIRVDVTPIGDALEASQ